MKRSLEIFLDETWLNCHAAPKRFWVDCDGAGRWRRLSGKGQRLIILHPGSHEGWVSECALVFRSKTKSEDYHDEMNTQHFMEWFKHRLLPQLPPHSLIIVDNAKYHNAVVEKAPTKNSTKTVMKEWLDKCGIAYLSTDLNIFKDCCCKCKNCVQNGWNSPEIWSWSCSFTNSSLWI